MRTFQWKKRLKIIEESLRRIQTSYLLEIDNTQQRIKLVINPSACLAFPSESILAWHKSLKHFPYISRRITILYLLALLPLKPAAQAESAARLMRRARFSIAIIRLIYWYGTWNSHLIVFDYTKFIFVGGEKHVSRWRRWVWWIGCDVTAHTFLPSYFIRVARFISRSQHCLRSQSETINAEVESERAMRRDTIDQRPHRPSLDSTLFIMRHYRRQWLKDLKRWPMIKREWIKMSLMNDSTVDSTESCRWALD